MAAGLLWLLKLAGVRQNPARADPVADDEAGEEPEAGTFVAPELGTEELDEEGVDAASCELGGFQAVGALPAGGRLTRRGREVHPFGR